MPTPAAVVAAANAKALDNPNSIASRLSAAPEAIRQGLALRAKFGIGFSLREDDTLSA